MALLHVLIEKMSLRGGAWGVSCVLIMLVCVGPVSTVLAQHRDNPARQLDNRPVIRRGMAEPVIDGHGWLAVQEVGVGGQAKRIVLLHLPARELGGGTDSSTEVMEGVLRVAGEVPGHWQVGRDGLAWWRNRVYLEVEDRVSTGETRRRVLTREALRGIGAAYEYLPFKEFMELPPLPPCAAFLGMATCEQGPVVWLAEGSSGATPPNVGLWVIESGKWLRANSPWGESGAAPVFGVRRESGETQIVHSGIARLMSWRDGLAIAISDEKSASIVVWTGCRSAGTGATIQWQRSEYLLGELASVERASVRLAFVEAARVQDDALIAVVIAQQRDSVSSNLATVYQLRTEGKPIALAAVAGVPREATVVAMASAGEGGNTSGLVTLVWKESTGASPAGSEAANWQVREISAVSGRTLYTGPSLSGTHVARPMLQWIVVLALLAGIGGMVYGLASDPRIVPVLPLGVKLADPIRRLVASLVDYVPSAILVAMLQGRSAMVLLMPSTMLGGADAALGNLDLRPIGLAILVTILHTSVCEWLHGKSLGKFVMGIRVVSTPPVGADAEGGTFGMARPGLGQVLVRNMVRWVVPMLALFGMLDVAGRHPGDLAARTLVVADPNDGN